MGTVACVCVCVLGFGWLARACREGGGRGGDSECGPFDVKDNYLCS